MKSFIPPSHGGKFQGHTQYFISFSSCVKIREYTHLIFLDGRELEEEQSDSFNIYTLWLLLAGVEQQERRLASHCISQ